MGFKPDYDVTDKYRVVASWLDGERIPWPSKISDPKERARRWKELAMLVAAEDRRAMNAMSPHVYACTLWLKEQYTKHVLTLSKAEQQKLADGVHPSLQDDFREEAEPFAHLLYQSLTDLHDRIDKVRVERPHGSGLVLVVHLRVSPDMPSTSEIPEYFHAFRVFRVGPNENGELCIYHPYYEKPENDPVLLKLRDPVQFNEDDQRTI